MNFEQEPTFTQGALSDIIFDVFDATYVNAGFYYQFDVYAWRGANVLPGSPVVTIVKDPDVYRGGRAYIDAGEICQQYINSDDFDATSAASLIGDGAAWLQVEVQGFYDGGSTSQITSTMILTNDGYYYTNEDINTDYDSTKILYIDREIVYVTDDTPYFHVWFNANLINSIEAGAWSQGITAPTGDSSEEIQGVDILDVLASAGLSGTNATITFTDGAANTQTLDVVYDCVNRYGEVTLFFLNRYGVYDSYVFNALSRETRSLNESTYQQPAYVIDDMNYSRSTGQHLARRFNNNAKRTMAINTNWIREVDVETINQLMMSQNVTLFLDGSYYSARIIDQNYIVKKQINEKLIQYTLQLEFSQHIISKLSR